MSSLTNKLKSHAPPPPPPTSPQLPPRLYSWSPVLRMLSSTHREQRHSATCMFNKMHHQTPLLPAPNTILYSWLMTFISLSWRTPLNSDSHIDCELDIFLQSPVGSFCLKWSTWALGLPWRNILPRSIHGRFIQLPRKNTQCILNSSPPLTHIPTSENPGSSSKICPCWTISHSCLSHLDTSSSLLPYSGNGNGP